MAKSNRLLAIIRLTAVIIATAVICSAAWLHFRFLKSRHDQDRAAALWTGRFGRTLLRLMGVQVHIRGRIASPALIISNHISYLDILVFSLATNCVFIPKSEVAAWGLIGPTLQMMDYPFVTREDLRTLRPAAERSREVIANQVNVTLFAEGTTGGGMELLPFQSSLFEIAVETGTRVQPVAIRYRPANSAIDVSEDIAYWKDHDFGPHVLRLAGLRGIRAEIIAGKPIPSGSFPNRKALRAEMEKRVQRLFHS